jgi:hypothetical protein
MFWLKKFHHREVSCDNVTSMYTWYDGDHQCGLHVSWNSYTAIWAAKLISLNTRPLPLLCRTALLSKYGNQMYRDELTLLAHEMKHSNKCTGRTWKPIFLAPCNRWFNRCSINVNKLCFLPHWHVYVLHRSQNPQRLFPLQHLFAVFLTEAESVYCTVRTGSLI